MIYRKEIDGLRALAVLPVVFFHSGLEIFSGGYVGVDVFFVISGFLITSILLSDLNSDNFSLLNFYERRARRILPVLFLISFCTIPFAWIWLDPFALKEFSQSLVSVFTFSSNIYFYLKTSYFDVASESKPLLHTWSLAVEEQFYIIFPVLLFIIWKYKKQYIASLFVFIFIASFTYSQQLISKDFSAAFYLLHSRAWELTAGALLALYLFKQAPPKYSSLSQFGSLAGLLLVLFSVFLFDESTPFPGLYALVPVLGTALIILFAVEGTLTNRFLSIPVTVFLGLISYSVYLWHQPVLAYYRIITGAEPEVMQAIALISLVIILSVFSYRFIETPFRKGREGIFSRNSIFAISLAGVAIFISLGLGGHVSNGYPERNAGFLRLQQNYGLSKICSGAGIDNPACRTIDYPNVVLWGDSHAMHLGQALSKIFSEKGLLQATLSACPPVPNYRDTDIRSITSCVDYNNKVMDYLRQIQSPSEHTVIVSAAKYLTMGKLKKNFSNGIAELKSLGFQIVYISTTPHFPDVGQCIISTIRNKRSFDQCQYDVEQIRNLVYFTVTKELADELGVLYVDLLPFFCNEGKCVIEKDGLLLLRDDSHIAVEATPLLINYIQNRIDKSM